MLHAYKKDKKYKGKAKIQKKIQKNGVATVENIIYWVRTNTQSIRPYLSTSNMICDSWILVTTRQKPNKANLKAFFQKIVVLKP